MENSRPGCEGRQASSPNTVYLAPDESNVIKAPKAGTQHSISNTQYPISNFQGKRRSRAVVVPGCFEHGDTDGNHFVSLSGAGRCRAFLHLIIGY